ncbi:daptide-type RiPP biosynthesis aminotransferase [Frankia sp. AgB32]|uniref:daptide-type RiPP biosynthesis aminotransferase n=1 Tax=Frankia sp. AgB32 TaxID=631119 RepID=UPI00200DB583|nr:daptide-type RiPP biosynthesis aminotransferase [Frankia sp. AgB32]MCK9896266.1 aminotransferase class III-fold pyridoxal phosphate-dependent enzyme [Frankia sp. AgB32]
MTTAAPLAPGPVWELICPPSQWYQPDRQAVGARGTRLWFADGTCLLDATSGLWNVNLGYGDSHIAEAIGGALRDASYLTMFRYGHRYATAAADALLEFAGRERYQQVAFATSGGAANDFVMKIVRQHALLTDSADRRTVAGLRGSYHGLTYGALALTGEDLGQRPYGANVRDVRHVDPFDPDGFAVFAERHGRRTAAVVIEPLLGSGAFMLPEQFVTAVLAARAEYGFLVVCDEVATGFGRTGRRFASDDWPEPPDLLVASKGMTNGTCAAAAVLLGERAWRPFIDADSPVIHGETQAGSPPSCAAVLATIERFAALDAVTSGVRVAARLDAGLRELAQESNVVTRLTGAGCFRGVQLRPDNTPDGIVTRTIRAIRRHGVLVHPGPNCIQLVPPLTCSDDDVDTIVRAVRDGLRAVDTDPTTTDKPAG